MIFLTQRGIIIQRGDYMKLFYNLGRIYGMFDRELKKVPFILKLSFLWLLVSNVNFPDYMVQNFFGLIFLVSILLLIYGAIGFRCYLILNGTRKILKNLTKEQI